MDAVSIGAGIDAYAFVRFGNQKGARTKVKKDLNPVWNEEVRVPVTLPSMTDQFEVSVYDRDIGSKGETLSIV